MIKDNEAVYDEQINSDTEGVFEHRCATPADALAALTRKEDGK